MSLAVPRFTSAHRRGSVKVTSLVLKLFHVSSNFLLTHPMYPCGFVHPGSSETQRRECRDCGTGDCRGVVQSAHLLNLDLSRVRCLMMIMFRV